VEELVHNHLVQNATKTGISRNTGLHVSWEALNFTGFSTRCTPSRRQNTQHPDSDSEGAVTSWGSIYSEASELLCGDANAKEVRNFGRGDASAEDATNFGCGGASAEEVRNFGCGDAVQGNFETMSVKYSNTCVLNRRPTEDDAEMLFTGSQILILVTRKNMSCILIVMIGSSNEDSYLTRNLRSYTTTVLSILG
jgi:hypothetical protein